MPKSPTGRTSVHPILMTREQAIDYINAADTKEMRQQRKAEVYHILYSAGPDKLRSIIDPIQARVTAKPRLKFKDTTKSANVSDETPWVCYGYVLRHMAKGYEQVSTVGATPKDAYYAWMSLALHCYARWKQGKY